MRLLDDAFAKVCDGGNDPSKRVRAEVRFCLFFKTNGRLTEITNMKCALFVMIGVSFIRPISRRQRCVSVADAQ